MTENETQPESEHVEPVIERGILTDAAIVATPVAIALQPVIEVLADKYIGQSEPPPPEQPKQD